MESNEIRQPVTIQIPKEAIMNCYSKGFTSILDSFVPALCQRNRNRVDFEVLGYLDDSRELYDIAEVRKYFANLFINYDGLFYWINLDSKSFLLLALLLFKPVKFDGKAGVSPSDLQKYLFDGFIKLNNYCRKNGMDPNPSSIAIRDWVKKNIKRG